jgi:protease secretion system membrane fusion protein
MDMIINTATTASTESDIDGRTAQAATDRPFKLGLWVLGAGFGGFMLWASLAPLDEGVSVPATVAIETRRRVIQHMNGGVVRKVLVKEGQTVNSGDVLLELEDAAARANYEAVRQNYMALRAAESRLLAEQADQSSISFHGDLLAGASDPFVQQHMTTQNALFAARHAALESELASQREAIGGLRAQIAGYASMSESRQTQATLLAQQLRNLRELADEGYAPRNQVLQLEQAQAELRATQADLKASRLRAEQSIAELTARMAQRRQEYRKEAGNQLSEVRREVQADQDKLRAVNEELARVTVRSPADGQVVGLAVSSVGGVVTPGQRLMDIVPRGETLLVDARIPPHVIDRVRAGTPTDVRFSAFVNSPQLVLDGRLVSVSADAVTEQQGAAVVSYYLGRVEVTPAGLKQLGPRVMQPGMPAEVLVRTGERSLLTYLLHPLTKRLAAAMKEE